MQILKCPYCNDAWLYVSDGGYISGYESKGCKIECRCGFAWKNTDWKPTREEAIKIWNDKANEVIKWQKQKSSNFD